jgi:hypothetical protein
MENNTKIAIGLAAAGVVGYIVYKSSKPKTQTQSGSTPANPAPKNTTDRYICPKGYTYGIQTVGGVVGIRPACKDANGNWSNPYPSLNPDYVGTKKPECICESYPCNCGGQTSDYGYDNSLKDNKGNIGNNWDLSGIDFEIDLQRSGQI